MSEPVIDENKNSQDDYRGHTSIAACESDGHTLGSVTEAQPEEEIKQNS